jgi:hypothetical protein
MGQLATHVSEVAAGATHRSSNGQFVRHFVEMIVAMIVGMAALGGLVSGVLALLGHSGPIQYVELRALLMAAYMTVGMSLWMRHRGHDWPRISEMAGAMFGPFVLLLGPFWAGFISSGGLLAGGHVLMLPFMLGVMLLHREEYSQDHRQHAVASPRLARGRH